MTRAALLWGGAAVAIATVGGASLTFAAVATATPEAHVMRYLEALAGDDVVDAARLAGLSPDVPLPFGDDRDPTIIRVIDRVDLDDGNARVVVEYGTELDAVTAVFTLMPAPAHLGIVPVWQFARTPIATVVVGVDHHDRLLVNDTAVSVGGPGDSVEVTAFVPSLVSARLSEAYVTAPEKTVRVSGSTPASITLQAQTTSQLHRVVERELEQFLVECTEQRVLLPTGCPFGRSISERVIDRPQWQLVAPPDIEVASGLSPGRWEISGSAELRLTVQVQRLRDGRLSEIDETVVASLSGDVVLTDEGPVVTVYPPRD